MHFAKVKSFWISWKQKKTKSPLQPYLINTPLWVGYDIDPILIWESLGNQLFESKKTQTLKKLHNGIIITWYWYHIVIRIGTKQPYFGIKIFGQWYQSNLALVPNNTRVKFPKLKMTNLPLFESPNRLKRLVAKTSSSYYIGLLENKQK